MNDCEIIRLFFERSEQAIAALAAVYGAAIRRVTAAVLKNPQDVEECVNDTYLKVWHAIPPQRPRHLGAFCCRVARNIALDRCSFNLAGKRNGYYDAVLDELAGSLPSRDSVEQEYDARELAGCINRFLGALSPEDRRLFVHRYWLGADIARLAADCGRTEHAVSVRLFRIRKKLQKYLTKEGVIA